jgi:malate dehydrogenase
MMEVAIVGAGDLGGAIAHRVARRGRVRRVTLVDERSQAASGKALDIMQAGPVEGFSTRVTSAADVVAAAGASVFVLADRLHGGEWQGEEGLTLLGRIRRLSPEAIVICAGAGHRELVERGTREAGWSRSSIFGSAPEALAGALRALVALELNGSAGDVALAVLGVPSRPYRGPVGGGDDWRAGRDAGPRRTGAPAVGRSGGASLAGWIVCAGHGRGGCS